MSQTTVALKRAWNSWDSEHPAAMRFLPLGLSVVPCAYASSANAFTRFPASGAGVWLGPRSIDGSCIELELGHAGTRLRLTYRKPDPFTLVGTWESLALGEWGLRFWLMLCLRLSPPGAEDPAEWRYDPASGGLAARAGPMHVTVRGERPPLLATFHDNLEALQHELETKGYFCLDSRGQQGRLPVLRYHLEEMPRFSFAVTLAQDPDLARGRAGAALTPARCPAPEPRQEGSFAGALDAVRDVIGWNTVWDPANARPYTTLSRNWVAQKFGGWGVWLDDVLYHALMAGLIDAELARENLEAVLAGATPQGNLPCLVTGRDAWVDRSQPPIGAFIVWMLHLRTGSRALLERAFGPLLRNHEWWWRERDGNANGLLEYGTSAVGEGLYRGTKLAAKDESSMDNSPVHDEAALNPRTGTLNCEDVGLNSLLALDGEMLACMARTLGERETADRLDQRSAALKESIATRLWDESRGVFANRLWSGRFVRSLAPTSFYPLLAGAASPEQAAAMLRLLQDERKFGGTWLLPSVARDDPAFADNVYWRGRIWPPLNFLVWHGLRRCGYESEATALAENGYRLFMREWQAHRRCPENFSAVTGEACDQPDTDTFYGWGALLPYLAVAEVTDVNPWGGWEVANLPGDVRLGPILAPAGQAVVERAGGWLTLSLDGAAVLRSSCAGRFRRLRFAAGAIHFDLPAGPGVVELPGVSPSSVRAAFLGDAPLRLEAQGQGVRFEIERSMAGAAVDILLATADASG